MAKASVGGFSWLLVEQAHFGCNSNFRCSKTLALRSPNCFGKIQARVAAFAHCGLSKPPAEASSRLPLTLCEQRSRLLSLPLFSLRPKVPLRTSRLRRSFASPFGLAGRLVEASVKHYTGISTGLLQVWDTFLGCFVMEVLFTMFGTLFSTNLSTFG